MDTIYLYGDQIGRVQFIQHYGSDKLIVASARVSFGKDNLSGEITEKDKKLINYLIKNKHTSPLESCGITFKFVVPIFVARQHHRHRTWSFSEISRRYSSDNIQFYEPETFRTQHESNKQASNKDSINPVLEGYSSRTAKDLIISHHQMILSLYNAMLESGICREQARGILPMNLYTEYYGTCNLNNLFKFIDLRLHSHAQWEIYKVAEAMLVIMKDLFPIAVESYLENKIDQ